jgi:Zn-dependent protease
VFFGSLALTGIVGALFGIWLGALVFEEEFGVQEKFSRFEANDIWQTVGLSISGPLSGPPPLTVTMNGTIDSNWPGDIRWTFECDAGSGPYTSDTYEPAGSKSVICEYTTPGVKNPRLTGNLPWPPATHCLGDPSPPHYCEKFEYGPPITVEEPKHFECISLGACALVPGKGPDACDPLAGDCAPPTCTFSASPSRLVFPPKQFTNLSWDCPRATSCSIDQGVGAVSAPSGVKSVPVDKTTTYTLTCTNKLGGDTKNATVQVFQLGSGGSRREVSVFIVFEFVVFIFSVMIHEVAHGLTAERLGDPTARLMGRITLNPLRHIDPVGSVILPAILAFSGLPVIGWAKPVPYNPERLKNPRQAGARIAFAGPVSNLIIAVVFGLAVRFAGGALLNSTPLGLFFVKIIYLNIILAVFNLIPIPPLDGSRVLFGMLPHTRGAREVELFLERYGFMIILALVFWGFGIIEVITGALFRIVVGI